MTSVAFGPDREPHHSVHFYEEDDSLCDVVAEFLGMGLATGDTLVVIATDSHRTSFSERLRGRGFDLERASLSGQLTILDAEEALASFMVGSMPSVELFQRTIGSALKKREGAEGRTRVRAYGEMVDLLWRKGNSAAALRLEEMWNDLQRTHSFSLLCAHLMASFYKEPAGLRRICQSHSLVIPPVNGASTMSALAAEIAQRTEVEQALRSSIGQLRQSAATTERLMKVTAAIADAVTEDQVYEAVVDHVGVALQASSAGLWLLRDEGRTAELVRGVGYSEAAQRALRSVVIEETSIPVLDAIKRKQAVWIESQHELLQQYPHLGSIVTPGRTYRISCLPLILRGTTIGALGFTFEGTPPFDDDERDFLRLVARYSGQALDRVQLLDNERLSRQQAERSAARLGILYGLAHEVLVAANIQQVFDAALDVIDRALGARRSSVLTFDPEGVMRFRAWRGLSQEYRRTVEGHSPWSRDARAPEAIIVPDVAEDRALAEFLPLFRKEGIGALGFIPLVAGGRLLGKFMLYYDQPRQLASLELELAQAIANHVAAGISRFTAVDELQESVRYSEMFTAILGHDLRNPLGAIMNAAYVAMERSESEKVVKPLARIMSSGERMKRMIDQLLDFTRVRTGTGLPLEARRMDLVVVIRQVMDELEEQAQLRLEHTGETEGVWDPDRLSQVFSNLVANAVQHGIAEHGVDVRVDGTMTDLVRIEIRNMGAIPEASFAKLFEPMTAGQRRTNSQGLGLGLFISQQIVKAHGGRVDVRSSDATGTTFSVSLPRRLVGSSDS